MISECVRATTRRTKCCIPASHCLASSCPSSSSFAVVSCTLALPPTRSIHQHQHIASTMSTLFASSPGVVRTAIPVKSASAGARKSGVSASAGYQQQQQQGGQQTQETRIARKSSGGRIYRDEEHVVHSIVEKSEDENTSPAYSSRSMAVKSSSTMSPSMSTAMVNSSNNNARQLHANPAPSTTTTTSTDESLPPLVQSRRGGKDNIANIPPGANRPGLGKGKGKGYPAAPGAKGGKLLPYKRKADAATTASSDSRDDEETAARRREETDTEEDQSSSINVRSRSPRGVCISLLLAWFEFKS